MSDTSNKKTGLGDSALGDCLAMDEAVARVAATGDYTDEQMREARAGAETLLSETSPDGMREMRDLALALGMPAARETLLALVDYGVAPEPIKQSLRASIDTAAPEAKGGGCQEVTFFNAQTRRQDMAYLVLKACPANHNTTAQLDKLAPFIPPPRRPEIMKHLSALIYLGRSVYAKVAHANPGLIQDIMKYVPRGDRFATTVPATLEEKAPVIDATVLAVDPKTSTLCVHPFCPRRVGIFVVLSGEVAQSPAPSASSASSASPPK